MNLVDYLKAERGRAGRVSGLTGLAPAFLSQIVNGLRQPPPDRCPALETATAGEVTCEEMRPDVRWVRVPDPEWPHAAGRPCIDVAPQNRTEVQRAA